MAVINANAIKNCYNTLQHDTDADMPPPCLRKGAIGHQGPQLIVVLQYKVMAIVWDDNGGPQWKWNSCVAFTHLYGRKETDVWSSASCDNFCCSFVLSSLLRYQIFTRGKTYYSLLLFYHTSPPLGLEGKIRDIDLLISSIKNKHEIGLKASKQINI